VSKKTIFKSLKEAIKKNEFLYPCYLSIFNNKIYRKNLLEFRFYKDLKLRAVVFDIGANVGNKTALFLKLGVKVISLEPDEDNYKLLHKRFGKKRQVTLLPVAASNKN
jgi:16S rRNA A1518/A1519 N6-dimethyltransferase RsmA/KsgA/DIM1 with predicted DNA glycosylase/AP lyase activity